jgi:hypothetical protein
MLTYDPNPPVGDNEDVRSIVHDLDPDDAACRGTPRLPPRLVTIGTKRPIDVDCCLGG